MYALYADNDTYIHKWIRFSRVSDTHDLDLLFWDWHWNENCSLTVFILIDYCESIYLCSPLEVFLIFKIFNKWPTSQVQLCSLLATFLVGKSQKDFTGAASTRCCAHSIQTCIWFIFLARQRLEVTDTFVQQLSISEQCKSPEYSHPPSVCGWIIHLQHLFLFWPCL